MKKLLTVVVLIASILPARAQDWFGTSLSNYGGVDNLYLNPANLGHSPYIWHFRGMGYGAGFSNGYARYNAPFSLHSWAFGTQPLGYRNNWQDKWLEPTNTFGDVLSIGNEWRLPSFSVNDNRGNGFAFNWRNRKLFQATGFNREFYDMIRYGVDSARSGGNPFFADKLSNGRTADIKEGAINADNWMEFAFSWAGMLANTKRSKLSLGVTGKFNLGWGAMHMHASDFSISRQANDTVTLSGARISMGYTDGAGTVNNYFNSDGPFGYEVYGVGAGFDIGFKYEHQNSKYTRGYCPWGKNRTSYDYKIAASLTDIGANWYGNQAELRTYTVGSQKVGLPSGFGKGFDDNGINGFDRIDNTLDAASPAPAEKKNLTMALPAALNIQADVRLNRNWFLGANYTQSLRNLQKPGTVTPNHLVVSPRYERWWFEAAFPVSVTNNFQQVNMGAFLKLGPFWAGTNNFGGLMAGAFNQPRKAADIYAGFSFGLATCADSYRDFDLEKRYDTTRKDTVKQQDTIKQRDTIKQKDTLKTVSRDTVFIKQDCPDQKKLADMEAQLKAKDARIKELENQAPKDRIVYLDKPETVAKVKELEDENATLKAQVAKAQDDLKKCQDSKTGNCSELQAKVDKLVKENETLKGENATLKGENATLTGKANKAQDDLKKCQDSKTTVVNCTECETNLATLKKENETLKGENATLRASVSKLEEDNAAKQKKIDELWAELDYCNKQKTAGGSDVVIADLKAKVAKLQGDNETLTKENETLKDENTTLKATVSKTGQTNADLTAQVATLKADNDAKQKKIDELTAQLADCTSKNDPQVVNDLKAQVSKLQGDNATLKSENDGLKGENSTLKATVTKLQEENENLKGQLDEKQKKIDELWAELDYCNKQKGSTGGSGYSSDNADLKAKVAKVEDENKTLLTKLSNLEDENTKLSGQVNSLGKEKAALEEENTTLKAKVSSLNGKIADLEDELSKCKGSSCQEEKDEIGKLEQINNTLKAQVALLEKKNDELKAEVVTYKNCCEGKKTEGGGESGGGNNGETGSTGGAAKDDTYGTVNTGSTDKPRGRFAKSMAELLVGVAAQAGGFTVEDTGKTGGTGTRSSGTGAGNTGTVKSEGTVSAGTTAGTGNTGTQTRTRVNIPGGGSSGESGIKTPGTRGGTSSGSGGVSTGRARP